MPRILAFTSGPQDWRTLLAQPDKQWRTGFSARTLAHCWEEADGFPSEVARAFSSAASDPLLANLVPVLAVPEFKVPLPGGKRASQNDIFVLAKSRAGPVAMMVEGKVKETFGPTILDWLVDASSGKQRRLEYLAETIGLAALPPSNIRYQLLHRAASAVIVGEQFRAAAAVLLVHTFSIDRAGWSDYQAFVRLFSIDAVVDEVQRLPGASKIPLYAAWVTGNLEFLAR
jgi:hypothetical protein